MDIKGSFDGYTGLFYWIYRDYSKSPLYPFKKTLKTVERALDFHCTSPVYPLKEPCISTKEPSIFI